MADVFSFETKRKQLTPEQLLDNATEDGQDKVMIISLRQDGEVGIWASDGISPSELLFMSCIASDLVGGAALKGRNTKTFFDGFIED